MAYIGLCVIVITILEVIYFDEIKHLYLNRNHLEKLDIYLWKLHRGIKEYYWYETDKPIVIDQIPEYKMFVTKIILSTFHRVMQFIWISTELTILLIKKLSAIIYEIYILIVKYYSSK